MPEEVQPEGRSRMSYDEFLRGAAVIAPARRAAFEVVRRVFEEEAYADRALAAAVEGLDDRDRALAQRLAYGTVQRARTIDFGIEQLGKRPVRKLDPPVRAALRLGAYQLAWTDQAGARGRRRRGRARARGAAASARCRSRTPSCGGSRRASAGSSRRCPKGRSSTRIPTGSPRSWARDFGARRGARADARAERAAGARGSRGRAGRRADRCAGRLRRRARRS